MESTDNKNESWRDIVSILFIAYLTPIAAIPVWLISKWSAITKWIVTIISILSLAFLTSASVKGYKFVHFQKSYTAVMGVQQALDIYGIANGKYPDKLEDLKPKYLVTIPEDKELNYEVSSDKKSYSLKAKVEGKNVELRPAFNQIPAK